MIQTLAALAMLPAAHASAAPMAHAINEFTFKMIKATGVSRTQNYLISPFSISTAMGMVLPGAQPNDQKLLTSVIAPGMPPKSALAGYGALIKPITNDGTVSVANSAWAFHGMKVNSAYESSLKTNFGGAMYSFSRDTASLAKINKWVDTKTKHRIPTILDSIHPFDRLFLINAVTFDGQWDKRFDKSKTYPQPFNPATGSSGNVPMMHMTDSVGYQKDGSMRAIKLNYKGNAFSMVLMLPEKGNDAGALLKRLDAKQFDHMMANFDDSEKVEIALPRFKFTDSFSLKEPLSTMGLGRFFLGINLSRISDNLTDSKIDRVIHKTFIDVDEKGTKAAAATAVAIAMKAIRADRPQFIANRPFAFLIIHNPTHAILFGGVVNDPRKNS